MSAPNLREQLRIQASLGLIGAFLLVGGFYGAFDTLLYPALVILLLALAAISASARAWVDVALALGMLASYVSGRFVFSDLDDITYLLRTSALNAYLLLHLVLLIGPWSWWNRQVMRLLRHRRHFGVSVFLLACLHFALVLRTYYGNSLADAFQAVFTFFGFTALYLFAFLAVTSTDHYQKHVRERTWQAIQLGMLGVYAALTWWMFSLQSAPLPLWAQALPVAIIVFGLLVMRNPLTARAVHRVWGWKQLHLLVWAAYASVVAHVWNGVAVYQPWYVQLALWGGVAFVLGSHVVGLALRWHGDREARQRPLRIGKELIEDGMRFIAVGREEEFRPGVGQKFFVAGNPVAVFKLSSRYLAVSNVCAHQKGPLYKGHINAAGHLECPWHGWEYSVEDGCGPPAFRKDCVPFYRTSVRDGLVYVAATRSALPPDVPKPSRAAGDVP